MQYLLNDSERTRIKLNLDAIETIINRLKRQVSVTSDKDMKKTGIEEIKIITEKLEDIKKMKIL